MRNKNKFGIQLNACYSKTVRLDSFTYDIINNYRGYNFSERLRNYIFDKENNKLNEETVPSQE